MIALFRILGVILIVCGIVMAFDGGYSSLAAIGSGVAVILATLAA